MTVSYTCQKPIKFWAKCKINLLYKLNQSLLCVPGCPLLLATRLRTWAPLPSSLILCSSLTCIHKSPFPPVWGPALVASIWPSIPTALLLCYPLIHWTCFTNPQKTSSICYSVSTVLLYLVPVCDLWRVSMLFPFIFPYLSQLASDKCPLPFPPSVSICYIVFFVSQFLCR